MIVRALLCLVLPLVLCAAGSSPSHATPAPPLTVSPGSPSMALPVEARCPTFSWATSPAAASYELVVYELGPDEEPALRLRESVPASVGSWTPDLTRCLERGLRYAWSVRAVAGAELSSWSSPRLLVVAGADQLEPVRAFPEIEAPEVQEHRAEREAPDSPRIARSRSASGNEREARPTRVRSAGTIPNKLIVSGAVTADLFNGSGSGLLNVDADTVDGLDANAFALAAHGHDAGDIGSGVLADARIPAGVARDGEVAATYLPLAGGALVGDLGVGTNQIQAGLHVEGSNIVVPADYLFEDDLIVEDQDAVLGLYSSTDGVVGSAIVLGETPQNSLIFFEKWAIVRETLNGGQDLRFTFGSSANYANNPIKFEIGNDGELTGKGIPRAFGVIDADGKVLVGSENISKVTVSSFDSYSIVLDDISLHDCSVHPVLVSVRQTSAIRSGQYVCNPPSSGFEGNVVVAILDSFGARKLEQFSFFVY
jgi:hypothetical protein